MSDLPDGSMTLYPGDEWSSRVFPEWDETRVRVDFEHDIFLTDEWQEATTLCGRVVEVRRADCGGGCRCAGEVRFVRRVDLERES